MKKFLAAAVAAAFTLSAVNIVAAAPAQIDQRHSQATEIQAATPGAQATTKKPAKKKAAKKTAKKKQTAKKPGAKKPAA